MKTDLQKYIHKSRYARYLEKEKRRESWEETVARYCDYFKTKFPNSFPYDLVYNAIVSMEVMPSMRALMTAGKALDRDHVAGFNCSYVAVDDIRCFDEIFYILMCGTGVGFSVERQYVNQLPIIAEEFYTSETVIKVSDSKIGWATALRELISLLYQGKIPSWDVSSVREAGARLKTFGGRASGPAPLVELFNFTVDTFQKAKGRKLNSVEVHDLVCKIAESVVVGGVRRSALISLSNLTDERMRNAKNGQWWEYNKHRALANNSVAYTELPDVGIFMDEWKSLYDSKSGERGIFNRRAAKLQAEKTQRRDSSFDFGTNPCGEIILRPNGFCNLSEVVVRENDNEEDLKRKVEIATIIGTFQSTLSNFRYLRSIWKKNAEEERLLGVSLTGILDNSLLNRPSKDLNNLLENLKNISINTNKIWAEILNINISASITTIKPSGTVSQLVDSASGIHPRYSRYYRRTVRADKKDPLSSYLIECAFPYEEDVMQSSNWVFSFPVKSPESSLVREDLSAIDQLELYKTYKENWCEHNPSITVYVRENEWFKVGSWVYDNFDSLGGVSFLPYSDHIYRQAPYQPVSEQEYELDILSSPKNVNWDNFLEEEDNVESYKELACMGGICEI